MFDKHPLFVFFLNSEFPIKEQNVHCVNNVHLFFMKYRPHRYCKYSKKRFIAREAVFLLRSASPHLSNISEISAFAPFSSSINGLSHNAVFTKEIYFCRFISIQFFHDWKSAGTDRCDFGIFEAAVRRPFFGSAIRRKIAPFADYRSRDDFGRRCFGRIDRLILFPAFLQNFLQFLNLLICQCNSLQQRCHRACPAAGKITVHKTPAFLV